MRIQAVGVEHQRHLGPARQRSSERDRMLATSKPRTERQRAAAARCLEHDLHPRGRQRRRRSSGRPLVISSGGPPVARIACNEAGTQAVT